MPNARYYDDEDDFDDYDTVDDLDDDGYDLDDDPAGTGADWDTDDDGYEYAYDDGDDYDDTPDDYDDGDDLDGYGDDAEDDWDDDEDDAPGYAYQDDYADDYDTVDDEDDWDDGDWEDDEDDEADPSQDNYDDMDDMDDVDDWGDDPESNTTDAYGNTPDGNTYPAEYVQRLRRENAKYRTKARDAERNAIVPIIDAISDVLGDEYDYDNARPGDIANALTTQASNSVQAAHEAQVEAAVYKYAYRNGLDAEAVMDSRAFYKRVQALNPDAEDFDEQIGDLLNDLTPPKNTRTPGRKSGPPARSGADYTTGAAHNQNPGNPSFDQLLNARRKRRGIPT